jgi:hypothetical protein
MMNTMNDVYDQLKTNTVLQMEDAVVKFKTI